MSQEANREIAGFFCRWVLLVGAGLAVAVVAWGSLLATMGLAGEIDTTLAVGDWVAVPARGEEDFAHVVGAVASPSAVRGLEIGLAAVSGHPLSVVRTCPAGCAVLLDNPRAGTIGILVRGAPYGAAAYRTHRFRLLCVPRDERLFLIDARLASRAHPAERQGWRECLDAMRAAGWVALFHPGPVEKFHRCLRALRSTGTTEPVLFDRRATDATDVLHRVGRTLRRPRRREGIEVVTADGHLARRAHKRGFVTHWVGPGAAEAPSTGTLRRHRDVANLKDSLSR